MIYRIFSACRVLLPVMILSACPSMQLLENTPSPLPDLTQNDVYRGGNAQYQKVSFQVIPQWEEQAFLKSLGAFKNSCLKLINQDDWRSVCVQANLVDNHADAKAFFEQYFTPWQVHQVHHVDKLSNKMTGYYEVVLAGDLSQTARARFPIYGIPKDLVSVPIPEHLRQSKAKVRIAATGKHTGAIQAKGAYTAHLAHFTVEKNTKSIKGRFVGNKFVPYHTREEINNGVLNGKAPILAYASDPMELFFTHIQGSAHLRTENGQYVRMGFADTNGHAFRSVAKYMEDKGYLPKGTASNQNIKAYIQANPHRLKEILAKNPRYIFYRAPENNIDQGPTGSFGVPLTYEYSAAVDKQYITMGAPIFVSSTHPDTQQPLNRLIVAQDVGSMINGPVRVDFFWGLGDEAGRTASKQNHPLSVWQLLPNGVAPRYRP